jgi:hypothetical protein
VVGTAAEPLKFLDIALRRAHELNPHGLALYAGDVIPPESGGARIQAATLKGFSVWFCRRFARVEAAREAEVKCGRTLARKHHSQAFKDWLEKLPENLDDSPAATTHIEHFLVSLSPLVPAKLEDSYDPPRKTLTDEHAVEHRKNYIYLNWNLAMASRGKP